MIDRKSKPPTAAETGETLAIDRSLADRAAEGDRTAFEEIYRRYVNRVYGLCLRLTTDVVEAESLTQDTFVKGWFAIAGYAGHGSLGGWLGRVAVNLWRDQYRAAARRGRVVAEITLDQLGVYGTATSAGLTGTSGPNRDGVIDLLTGLDLERCIARLPEGGRLVFVFHDVEGYTHREIAELLDLAVGTVKAQLHRARRLLRNMLAEDREAAHGA
ncbi:MAG: sigma-70 family RNA polymerase sigma factor [Candidatus Krumholzibacteria bacterium]|nr:sigma-70 family RNA polymerase sigma factor [Candidatus Krumholzibacteria bacterium]